MVVDTLTIKRIATLHPVIRDRVLQAYLHINNKLLGKGVRLRFAYTYRTGEEQDSLYSIGRTKLYDKNGKKLGKVTNAKSWQSIHNYGLAFDIVLLYDKNGDGVFETASWNSVIDFDKDGKADWMEVVDYFKSVGFEWGGDWKNFKDLPHFQIDFNMSWRDMKKKIDSGEYIKEEIEGKEYKYITI